MPHYMFQFSYTPQAWAALTKNPVDRREAIRGLLEKQGGRLIDVYYCFGEYDGVILFEAPTAIAAAASAITGLSAGHLTVNHTTVLLTTEEAMEAMHQAGETAFQRPS